MSNIFDEILDYRVNLLRRGTDPESIPLTWEQEERLRFRCEQIDAEMEGRIGERQTLTVLIFGSREIFGMRF